MRVEEEPRVVVEPRPPVARGLGPWWLLALLVLAALGMLLGSGHLRRMTALLGGALILAAVVRAVLPEGRAGGLVVRGRGVDAAMLLALGLAVLTSGLTLDLSPR